MSSTKKVAVYCRVSSDEQTERGTIVNQQIFAEKYIDLHKLEVYDWYMDDGVSGTVPLNERPEGMRLLSDAERDCFKTVLFYKIDRLGRSTMVILNAVNALSKIGVDIRSMTEPFDTSTPSGQFTLTMFAGIAELDRENILSRMRQGLLNSARKGKWRGSHAPYGYKVVDGYLAIDDEPIDSLPYSPKDVVLMIFDMCVKKKASTAQIADKLNALGIPPRFKLLKRKGQHSGKWFPTKVAGIIHNTIYYGLHIFGKNSTYKDKVIIEQEFPALISKDVWEEAQECLKANAGRPLCVKQRTYMLRGIIRCGNCGATYCGATPRRNDSGRYYRCHNKSRYLPGELAKERCNSKNIRADWIEELVWQDCLRYIMQPDVISEEVNSDDNINKIKTENDILQANLCKTEQERKTAVNLCIKGLITEDDLAEQLSQIDTVINDIKSSIAENNKVLNNIDNSQTINKLAEIKQRLTQSELSEREKQLIIQDMVEKVTVITTHNDDEEPKLSVDIKYYFGASKNDCKYNPYMHGQGFAAHTRLKRAGKAILARTRDMLTTPSSNG